MIPRRRPSALGGRTKPLSRYDLAGGNSGTVADRQRPVLGWRGFFARDPRRLPVVLSPEEVARLLAAAPERQVPGGPEHRLRRRPARLQGHLAQGRRYRQRPDADPGRSRQRACPGEGRGPQGPLRDAVAAIARSAATGVAGQAAKGVAVSRPGSWRTPHVRQLNRAVPKATQRAGINKRMGLRTFGRGEMAKTPNWTCTSAVTCNALSYPA